MIMMELLLQQRLIHNYLKSQCRLFICLHLSLEYRIEQNQLHVFTATNFTSLLEQKHISM